SQSIATAVTGRRAQNRRARRGQGRQGSSMKQIVGLGLFALLLAVSSSDAQFVVKQEPFEGQMAPGGIVLVDDGTCGKGKIKEVTGGELSPAISRPRTRRCIPRAQK